MTQTRQRQAQRSSASEKVQVERELNLLMEATLQMEHELFTLDADDAQEE